MRTIAWRHGYLVLTALVAGTTPGTEEKLPLDKLPAAVVAAVKDRFPRGELVEAARETEDGRVEYEVTLKRGEILFDVMVTPAGTITLIEKSIAVEDLPKRVAAAVAAQHPAKKITRAEEVIKVSDDAEKLQYYEVAVQADGKTVELEIAPNGKLKGESGKGKAGEDEDDDDEDEIDGD